MAENIESEETVLEPEETQETQAQAKTDTEPEIDKAKEWEDKYIRLYAEYDNYKKRTQREKDARYSDAVIDTVAELLSVADNLQRAIDTEVTNEEAVKLREGVAMVHKQMLDTLSKIGVTEIPAVGEQFDPNLHNAVMHIEDETVDDNTIVEEFIKGYAYKNGRVVRYAMVKVAN